MEARRRIFLAIFLGLASLAALGAIGNVTNSAFAQTAFYPCRLPPFRICPWWPPVSGNWTVMVGIGGRVQNRISKGANRSMLSPVPDFFPSVAPAPPKSFRGPPRPSASIAFNRLRRPSCRVQPSSFVASRKANQLSRTERPRRCQLPRSNSAASSNTFRSTGSATRRRTAPGLLEATTGGPLPTSLQTFIVPVYQGVHGFGRTTLHMGKYPGKQRPYFWQSMPYRAMTTGLPVFNAQGPARIRTAPALRYPIGSIRNGKFIPMSSNQAAYSGTRRRALSFNPARARPNQTDRRQSAPRIPLTSKIRIRTPLRRTKSMRELRDGRSRRQPSGAWRGASRNPRDKTAGGQDRPASSRRSGDEMSFRTSGA